MATVLPICCNNCFRLRASSRETKYFIANCTHVLCETCLNSNKTHCMICRKDCRLIEMNQNTPDNLKDYFNLFIVDDLEDQIKKISLFQSNQLELANNRSSGLTSGLERVKREIALVTQKNSEMKQIYNRDVALIKELEVAKKTGFNCNDELVKRYEAYIAKHHPAMKAKLPKLPSQKSSYETPTSSFSGPDSSKNLPRRT